MPKAVVLDPAAELPYEKEAEAVEEAHSVEETEDVLPPFTLVEQELLADGVLDIVRLEGARMLRIWTPPGYTKAEALKVGGLPVLYLNDGQNLFDPKLSLSGESWRCAETVSSLICSGQLPPFVVVGIDHSGPLRSWDYTPYKPGTGPGGFRKDAADWPGGGVNEYLDRVVNEIIPYVTSQYATSQDPAKMAFGGSSFGGICALCCAIRYPNVFGSILVESPSLWLAEEKFLLEDLTAYNGDWPARTFLAMGTREFSGIRAKADERPECDELLVSYVPALVKILEDKGVVKDRLEWVIEKGATHNEKSWAGRLPKALSYLLSPWWQPVAEANSNNLFFTVPRKLKAGKPAVLFLNKNKSDPLVSSQGVKLVLGFNNWTESKSDRGMSRAIMSNVNGADWWMVPIKVPATAYEMNLVFSDSQGEVWDNNAGYNFYIRVKALNRGQLADAFSSGASVQQLAEKNCFHLFFCTPEVLLSGGPVTIYINRQKSWTLKNSPNVKAQIGFNGWELEVRQVDLKPTSLWRGEGIDWWSTESTSIPEDAFELNLAFTDGHGVWDNNNGVNYNIPVKNVKNLKGQGTAKPRGIAAIDSSPHANGLLHIVTLTKREDGQSNSKARWTEEKRMRVWTPPGYDENNPPEGGWPVMYINDGQNMFEDWLAHQGVSWRFAYTASELILSGQLPPFVICALDSAGAMRSLNYLPYPPGTGVGGFRGDCERWPGGGLAGYMNRIVDEIIPLMVDKYKVATDPAKVSFGGGSFAGVTALYAAMHFPHIFGSVLAESPSLWVTEGRFLGDMAAHTGMLPERIFMACGTKEYSATRDHDRDDVDQLLLHYYCEAARILTEKGMRGDRLKFLVEEGAGHHELAWQWRLTGAMQFLLSPWWDE